MFKETATLLIWKDIDGCTHGICTQLCCKNAQNVMSFNFTKNIIDKGGGL